MLTRLIYYSENHIGASDGKMIRELNAILDASNRNNEKAGITGALLFDTVWFLQILEGDRETIGATLRRIMSDERHDGVTVMDAQTIEGRLFGNWRMGIGFLRGDTSAIYRRHGIGPRLDPRTLRGEQALGLARDLSASGLDRRVPAQAA